MSADCVLTGIPEFILTKEYTEKPKEEDLYEVFAVIYKVDDKVGNWESNQEIGETTEGNNLRFIFFTDTARAVARFKLFGPKRSILKRILTDSNELYEAGEKNNHLVVDKSESESEETKKEIEDNNKELEEEMKKLDV
jgi:hypothetical protein